MIFKTSDILDMSIMYANLFVLIKKFKIGKILLFYFDGDGLMTCTAQRLFD
jgi:hypothetical protein